ncbi:MAG: hypothetical protein ACK4TN_00590, partial [Brevinematales bacterium]
MRFSGRVSATVIVVLWVLMGCAFQSESPQTSTDVPIQDGDPRPGVGPDWRDQIIYFIMVDRFVDGNPANNGTVAVGSG